MTWSVTLPIGFGIGWTIRTIMFTACAAMSGLALTLWRKVALVSEVETLHHADIT